MSNAMAMWLKRKDKPLGKWLFARDPTDAHVISLVRNAAAYNRQ